MDWHVSQTIMRSCWGLAADPVLLSLFSMQLR